MSLECILLGMLQRPASGYDLKAEFDRSARHFWSAELSQIYPTLKRMEARGWVRAAVAPSGKGPERRVYQRTKTGREELFRWLRGDPQMGAERFAYLAQVCFMGQLKDPAASAAFFRQLRGRLAAWHAQLQAIEAEFSEQPGFPDKLDDETLHDHLALRMGLHSLAAKLKWCDECLQRLRKRGRPGRTKGR